MRKRHYINRNSFKLKTKEKTEEEEKKKGWIEIALIFIVVICNNILSVFLNRLNLFLLRIL